MIDQTFAGIHWGPFADQRLVNVCGRPAGYHTGTNAAFNTAGFQMGKDYRVLDNFCASLSPNLLGFGWNNQLGHGDTTVCRINEPLEANKYECCTNNARDSDTDHCGRDWCEGQGTCDTYMKNVYCPKDNNVAANDKCFTRYSDKATLAGVCSKLENFKLPNCQKFCSGEITSNTDKAAVCLSTAGQYCSKPSNFYDPECACINYKSTPDYGTNIKQFKMLETTNYQCWAAACAASGDWTDLLRSTSSVASCPQQLTICNQIMNLSDIKAQSLGSISQSCDSNQSRSTTNVTVAPGSISTPSSTSAPVSATVAPVTTAQKSTSLFSFLTGTGDTGTGTGDTGTGTPKPGSGTSMYLRVGGAGLSFFSSILSSILIIVMLFMFMK